MLFSFERCPHTTFVASRHATGAYYGTTDHRGGERGLHPDRGSVSYYSGSHSNPDDGDGDGDGARHSFLHAAAATHNQPSHVYRSLSFAGWCIAEPRGGSGGIMSRGERLRR